MVKIQITLGQIYFSVDTAKQVNTLPPFCVI